MSWVVIWATPWDQQPGTLESSSSWIMVKHKIRGWELPGGKINFNESIPSLLQLVLPFKTLL